MGAASDCPDCNTNLKRRVLAKGDIVTLKEINRDCREHTKFWMSRRIEDGTFATLSLECMLRADRDGWLAGMLDAAGSDWAYLPVLWAHRGKHSNARGHRLHWKPMVHYARGFGVGITFAPPFLQSGVDLNITAMLLTLDSIFKTDGFIPWHIRESFDGGDGNMDSSVWAFYGLLVHHDIVKEVILERKPKGHSHAPCDGENSRVTGVIKGASGERAEATLVGTSKRCYICLGPFWT
mmetsp:Transcript_3802/g.11798  ORF Transcript_3802/g.11798 Transcript_3802/m.11798 type:complete len:237 (+) Transcript_3802:1448-2158(+)